MKSRRLLLASAATLAVALWQLPVLFAAGASAGDDSSAAREGFRSDGSTYVSVASARGSSAEGAEKLARGAALRGLFDGLGKDRLFAEVFTASPPLSL